MTGESLPREVQKEDEILAGMVNLSGVVQVKVTKEFGESTVSRILELVENASSKKAPIERFITKFARVYTPTVVVAAILVAIIPPFLLQMGSFDVWLYRALTFLVVSCPCALVISIPLGLFAGIGGASRQGILVKGGNFLEILKDVDTNVEGRDVVFVEDIIDTGRTLKYLRDMFKYRKANSVKIATLFDKPEGRVVEIDADYVCYDVPNEFIVGFGLDYAENYRNLPYVGVLKEEVYSK